ncbi:MAG: type transporter [Ilumatobacteraceae bacterium]|nr:type transporter [Ilumatobacteraceae bacterium]
MNAATFSTAIPAPSRPPTAWATATTYAGRTVKQFLRTPQLLIVSSLTSVMFLLIFRYVFGGAIQTGSVHYVDFLIPALAAVGGLFSSGAVGVAEDTDSGLFDRLRSLPVPRAAVLLGRSMADTALILLSTVVTIVVGFLVGFRVHGSALGALAALGLCVIFAAAISWLQIFLGLISGNAQAAQGISFSVFPLVFVSSAYVPVESMPGWLRPIAENQPITAMVGAVRALVLGGDTQTLLGHSMTWFVVRSLLWSAFILALFATLSTRKFTKV